MVDAGVQIPLDALECRVSAESGSEAQPAERLLVKQRGVGSNPTRPLNGLEDTEGLADRRRRQPVANRPTREGLQVRPLSLPLQLSGKWGLAPSLRGACPHFFRVLSHLGTDKSPFSVISFEHH